MSWTALVARARGLSAHLLPEGALRSIESSVTVRELAVRLAEWRYLARDSSGFVPNPRDIELECRRVAADRLAVLERWAVATEDRDALLPFTLAEDVRSLRAIVRGAVARVAAGDRLAGLIPTRALPLRALSRLAGLADVASMRSALASWAHPLAGALEPAIDPLHADLLAFDCRMLSEWARVAIGVSGRGVGARSMRHYVAESIDLANAATARILATERVETPAIALFVPGGRLISRDDLVDAASRHDVGVLAARIRRQDRDGAVTVALSSESARLEDEILRARIEDARERVRLDPLDAGAIALLLLRLRAEQARIRRAAWSCALGGVQSRGAPAAPVSAA